MSIYICFTVCLFFEWFVFRGLLHCDFIFHKYSLFYNSAFFYIISFYFSLLWGTTILFISIHVDCACLHIITMLLSICLPVHISNLMSCFNRVYAILHITLNGKESQTLIYGAYDTELYKIEVESKTKANSTHMNKTSDK